MHEAVWPGTYEMLRAVSRVLLWFGCNWQGGLPGSTPACKNEVRAQSRLPVLSDLCLFDVDVGVFAAVLRGTQVLIDLIAGLSTQEPLGQYRGWDRGEQLVSQRNQSVRFRQPQSLFHRVVPGPKKASRRALV